MLILRKPHERLRDARNISAYYGLHEADLGHIFYCAAVKEAQVLLLAIYEIESIRKQFQVW